MLRNGPGLFKAGKLIHFLKLLVFHYKITFHSGDTEMKHWFDGLAFLQRYHFAEGKVGEIL